MRKMELANRLFFRLYQCANMLHKTGSRAVEAEGLTTQQWAVLGAVSREKGGARHEHRRPGALPDGEPAEPVGLIGRMERDGHVQLAADGRTAARAWCDDALGPHVWQTLALPKIHATTRRWTASRSTTCHTLHYLLKMLTT
jgi:hypothetical protein